VRPSPLGLRSERAGTQTYHLEDISLFAREHQLQQGAILVFGRNRRGGLVLGARRGSSADVPAGMELPPEAAANGPAATHAPSVDDFFG
jgi:hypothetical protein